jgi:hypothetical protein
VPQAGEQLAPPAVNVHVTPAFAASLETFAFTVTAAPPTVCFANLFVMLTLMGGTIVKLKAKI